MTTKKEMKVLKGTDRKDRELKIQTPDHLITVPKPKAWHKLDATEKKIFSEIVGKLIATENVRDLDLDGLALYAKEFGTYMWADNEIKKLNRKKRGSGYIQTYSTGAKNISPEMTVRERSFTRIIQLSKEFGLTFKSRYTMPEMFGMDNPNQMSLLEAFGLQKAVNEK